MQPEQCSENLKVLGCVTLKETFFRANVSRRALPYDSIKRTGTGLYHGIFPKYVLIFFGTAISQNSRERLHARKLYLFIEQNNICGRAAQGHRDMLNRIKTPCFYCENLLKSASVGAHPRLGNLNKAQRARVNIYLLKYCDFFQSTGKIS